jgi:hypothetical protein
MEGSEGEWRMKTFWLKFTDGSVGHCEGQSASDAVRIAEHITKKTVALAPEHKWQPEKSDAVQSLPYPRRPMIWQFEHPIYGKTPTFCHGGKECLGRGSCPQSYACTE